MANTITYEGGRRELAHRASCEIEVTLFWGPSENEIVVEVFDYSARRAFEVAVPPECALDAFEHPYAYRAGRHCASRDVSTVHWHSGLTRASRPNES